MQDETSSFCLRFPTLFSYDNKPALIASISYAGSKPCYHDKICSVSRKEALLSRYGTYLINVGFVSYENKAKTTLQRVNEIMNITT